MQSEIAWILWVSHNSRLDYATSGVICLGKTCNAAAVAGKLFEKRQVDKYYLAILTGHMMQPMIEVDVAIGERFVNFYNFSSLFPLPLNLFQYPYSFP